MGKEEPEKETDVHRKMEKPRQKEKSARHSNLQYMENSISVLCTKFCDMLKESKDTIINIEQAAQKLGTQKRRLHEILNIIQSVGLLCKVGVGTCQWLGEESMLSTLKSLKDATTSPRSMDRQKKAVATTLSEKFIQLFLTQDTPAPIELDQIIDSITCNQGNGESNGEIIVSPTRRLYDIANVLCSLQLIKKVLVVKPFTKRKQITYEWCGPIVGKNELKNLKISSQKLKKIVNKIEITKEDTNNRKRTRINDSIDTKSSCNNHGCIYCQDMMNSPFILKIKNDQLKKELELANEREKKLLHRIDILEKQVNKFIDTKINKKKQTTITFDTNSPLVSLLQRGISPATFHFTQKERSLRRDLINACHPMPFDNDTDTRKQPSENLSMLAATTLLKMSPCYSTNSRSSTYETDTKLRSACYTPYLENNENKIETNTLLLDSPLNLNGSHLFDVLSP